MNGVLDRITLVNLPEVRKKALSLPSKTGDFLVFLERFFIQGTLI